jgi:hypothetical protein
VKEEVARAHEMINKFKANLTKDKQLNADTVNAKLKQFIEQQKEDYRQQLQIRGKEIWSWISRRRS